MRRSRQCSACFIVSVKDSLESILDLGEDRRHAVQGLGIGHEARMLSALRGEDALILFRAAGARAGRAQLP